MSDTTIQSREDDYPGDWFVVRRPIKDQRPVVVSLDIRRRAEEREIWTTNVLIKRCR